MDITATTYKVEDMRDPRNPQLRRILIHGDGRYTPLADLLRQLADLCEADHLCLTDLRNIDVPLSTGRRTTATSIALTLCVE